MTNLTAIRLRVLPRFPARLVGANGFTVARDGAELVIQPDYEQLAIVPAVPDQEETFFQAWTRDIDTYNIIPFSALVANIQDVIIGANLSSISELETAADLAIYFTEEGEAALYTVSEFVRTVSGSDDETAFRSAISAANGVRQKNILDYEAVYDTDTTEAADANAAALADLLAACDDGVAEAVIPAGTGYLTPGDVGPLSGSLRVKCEATFINQEGAAATQRAISIEGDGAEDAKVFWRGGIIDENGGAFSGIEFRDWQYASVDIDEVSDIVCSESSTTSTSGLAFTNVVKGRASWKRMSGMEEGTSTQGSLPRCFSVSTTGGLRSDVDVFMGECEDVHGVVVVGDIGGGVVNLYGGVVRDAADNGVYNVGDASEVNSFGLIVDGIDEIFVNSGSGWIKAYNTIGTGMTNAIGLQGRDSDKPSILVSGAHLEFAPGVAPFKTRGGTESNETSGALIIENSTIICRPNERVFDLASFGTIEELVIRGSTFIIEFDSSVAGATTADGFWTIAAMAFGARGKIDVDDATTFILRDLTGDIPDNLRVQLNLDDITESSRFRANLVNETGNASVSFEIGNGLQQLLSIREGLFFTSGRNGAKAPLLADGSTPPRTLYGTTVPNVGYHPAGSRLYNSQPGAGLFVSQVCTAAGTPGTWEVERYLDASGKLVLQGANGYAGQTLAAGAYGSAINITVTGASAGDFIQSLAPSVLSQGEVWEGAITAANTVTARPRNPTSGSINTTSGNVRCRVQKL